MDYKENDSLEEVRAVIFDDYTDCILDLLEHRGVLTPEIFENNEESIKNLLLSCFHSRLHWGISANILEDLINKECTFNG